MTKIPKSLVDKVLPEAERLFQEHGVVALARALILTTKTQEMSLSFIPLTVVFRKIYDFLISNVLERKKTRKSLTTEDRVVLETAIQTVAETVADSVATGTAIIINLAAQGAEEIVMAKKGSVRQETHG